MRKLFLLVCAVFVVYYGASLWPGAVAGPAIPDAQWLKWLPLALMIATAVVGLVHMPTALALALVLIMLTGNFRLCGMLGGDLASSLAKAPASAEPILLGLFFSWIALRFFGNPELDYEYHRASMARALHFPVGVVCCTAVLAAVYAVLTTRNVFFLSFDEGMRAAVLQWPFSAMQGGGGIAPVRAVIRFIECVAVYTIVINELRTMRQVRVCAGVLMGTALAVAAVGFYQVSYAWYSTSLRKITMEMQSTFADPNSCAVFLLAMLPLCGAMMTRGPTMVALGGVCAAVMLVAIVLTGAKMATLLACVLVLAVIVAILVRAARKKSYWQLGLAGGLLVVLLAGYLAAKVVHARAPGLTREKGWAGIVVTKVDGTMSAFLGLKMKWDPAELNRRTCYKLGDFATALAMVDPQRPDNRPWRILSGIGYGCFAENYGAYCAPWASKIKKRDGASNMLLHTVAETGIFGALALALIVVCAVAWTFMAARSLKAPVFAAAVAASLLMVVLGCMTEDAFMTPQIQVLFWTLVGLCMVLTSNVTRTTETKDFYGLKFLAVVVLLGSWGYCVYTPVMTQRSDAIALKAAAEHCAEMTDIPMTNLLLSFETSGSFGFHSIDRIPCVGKEGLMLAKVTGPVLDITFDAYLPKNAKTKRQVMRVSIDDELLREVVFTNFVPHPVTDLLVHEMRHVEVHISSITSLVQYVRGGTHAAVRLTADRTFVPSALSENWKKREEFSREFSSFVPSLAWKDKMTPKQSPAPACTNEPAGAVAAPPRPPATTDKPASPPARPVAPAPRPPPVPAPQPPATP